MNIYNLYDLVINDGDLTTTELKNRGFSTKNLTSLVNEGKLERYKRGYYLFNDLNGLYKYGELLYKEKNFIKAKLCFLKCLEINAQYIKAIEKLFYLELKAKSYDVAFKYLDMLYHKDTDNRKLYNTYLFLFNYILDLPQEYRDIVKSINTDSADISIFDNGFKNMIKEDIFYQRFNKAILKLQSLHDNNNLFYGPELVDLLYKARNTHTKNFITMKDLIINKKYEELVLFLSTNDKKYNLNLTEKYCLLIAREIINIRNTEKIPEKEKLRGNDFKSALRARDYEKALKILIANNKFQDVSENILYLLLKDLIKEIQNVQIINNLDNILAKVKEDGLVILGEMEDKEIKNILNKLKDIPYISCMLMGDNDNILVLRYYEDKEISYGDLLENSRHAYFEFDYQKCIALLRELSKASDVSSVTYAKLAYAYIAIGNYELALKYLTVANHLNKKFNVAIDNSELIESLETNNPELVHVALQRSLKPF